MRCPSCLTVLTHSVEACPQCGFTLASLDKKFGTVPKNLRHLTDMAGIFDKKEHHQIEQKLMQLERRFPRLFVSVVTTEVHRRFAPREYFFWLVNRCRFNPLDDKLERSFFVVLFFDIASRTAFLTTGYGMQASLPEEKLQAILDRSLPEMRKGHLCKGALMVMDGIARNLQKASHKGNAGTLFSDRVYQASTLSELKGENEIS